MTISIERLHRLMSISPVNRFVLVLFVVLSLAACRGHSADSSPNSAVTGVNPAQTGNSGEGGVAAAAQNSIRPHPMSMESLKAGDYSADPFVVEKVLSDAAGYSQSVVSYRSEGLKIYGLLTVPKGPKPANGYPAIVFVHGYIPPADYSTTGSYAGYQARLASRGFVTFKPDLRGHGDSEGAPVSAHYSEKYVIDTLFAISALKKHEDVDARRIGYWGHSNGGEIGLRVVVVNKDVRAASFWAGVVGSYQDMFETYNEKIGFLRGAADSELVRENGLPSTNTDFWSRIDPYYFLGDIEVPVEIQHGTGDKSVPIELSRRLKEELEKAGVPVDYHEYPGDNHNLSNNLDTAFRRTVDFYNRNL
jgi:dipeptidyl aminopeptidase/acylaminoacyl peptidase